MSFKVYILWSDKLQKYYVGSTNDLEDRIHWHNTGQGKFTSTGMPWTLIWSYACVDRKEAMHLEMKIKKRGLKDF